MSDILKLSAYEMQKQMEQGQLGALEATEAYLAEIEKRAAACDRIMDVLVEINIAGEESKFGIRPENTEEF